MAKCNYAVDTSALNRVNGIGGDKIKCCGLALSSTSIALEPMLTTLLLLLLLRLRC